jgi:hypothetical protein
LVLIRAAFFLSRLVLIVIAPTNSLIASWGLALALGGVAVPGGLCGWRGAVLPLGLVLVGRTLARGRALHVMGTRTILPVQSFRTLLAHLGTRCRNTCVVAGDAKGTTFYQVTEADELQAEALRLIKM